MKVAICWTDISGYMAACWRELSRQQDIDLYILAYEPTSVQFDTTLLNNLPHRLLNISERSNAAFIEDTTSSFNPDVVVTPGWVNPAYVRVAISLSSRHVPIVMGMDTPYRGQWRQRLARYRLHTYFRGVSQVVVAGERSWQYARRLGFQDNQIHRGVYGYDHELFNPIAERRTDYPRQFLFVGRYVPEKGLHTLIDAYQQYRSQAKDPWGLTACGSGPLKNLLQQRDGIVDRGFIQPKDLPAIMKQHGAFVLPSRYEPWGVVVAEAAAAGMPIICTNQVGASIDIVRDFSNGRIISAGDTILLADALQWIDSNSAQLSKLGTHAHNMALPFSSSEWGKRWKHILNQAQRR